MNVFTEGVLIYSRFGIIQRGSKTILGYIYGIRLGCKAGYSLHAEDSSGTRPCIVTSSLLLYVQSSKRALIIKCFLLRF